MTPEYRIRVQARSQRRVALGIIHAWAKLHPQGTLEDLREAFPNSLNPDSGMTENFMPEADILYSDKWKGYFTEEEEVVQLDDGTRISVVDMWTKEKGYKNIVEKATEYGIIAEQKTDMKQGEFRIEEINVYTSSTTQSTPPLQKIFFGTPGSGKSYKIKEATKGKKVHRTTFHPDSDYASFVGCYKPTMLSSSDISYTFVPQVFTEAYIDAWQHRDEQVYLVIEEINRGNCAQIFGDLFQLLDRNAEGESDYRIKADHDLRDYLYSQLGKESDGIKNGELCLPSNLHILATMNTSDQSLFPMDSAFKRRWDWEYVPIDYSEKADSSHFIITLGEQKYRWVDFLKEVNQRIIDATASEDKQMGNFFIKGDIGEDEFKSKVMFYLWNEVCCDEYRTGKNFFRSDSDIEFSFNELFLDDLGRTKLLGFMSYLGVEVQGSNKPAEVSSEAE